MIRFLLSEKPADCEYNNSVKLGNYFLYYDDGLEVIESQHYVVFFCGILWEGSIQDFAEKQNFVPNGTFYCLTFDKDTQSIQIWTDFLEDFPVYHTTHPYLQISNSLVDFVNTSVNTAWFKIAKDYDLYIDHTVEKNPHLPNDYFLRNTQKQEKFKKQTYKKLRFENITPLNNVKRVGPGKKITVCNGNIHHNQYFSWVNDFYNLIYTTEKFDYSQALDYSQNILQQNCNTIRNKYKDIVIMASTGVDSLVILSMMPGHKVLGYYGYTYQSEDPGKLKELYNYLPNSILHYYDSVEYSNAYNKTLDAWYTPSTTFDLAPEMHLLDKYNFKDCTVVKGTFGDEIFGHRPRESAVIAKHQYQIDDIKIFREWLKDYYSYQEYSLNNNVFECIKNLSYEDSLMYFWYYKQVSYLKDDRILNNQMIVSPYIDIRLRKLLPLCNKETQAKTILNADLQKNMIDNKLIGFLNDKKYGGEESFDAINYKKIKSLQLESFCNKIINKQSNIF